MYRNKTNKLTLKLVILKISSRMISLNCHFDCGTKHRKFIILLRSRLNLIKGLLLSVGHVIFITKTDQHTQRQKYIQYNMYCNQMERRSRCEGFVFRLREQLLSFIHHFAQHLPEIHLGYINKYEARRNIKTKLSRI